MTHTQQMILAWLERHGPAPSAAIAEAHGMAQRTAGVHLNTLKNLGMVYATGFGQKARWRVGERPPALQAVARTDEPNPIWQCPSVWVYASRVAAQARQARPRLGL